MLRLNKAYTTSQYNELELNKLYMDLKAHLESAATIATCGEESLISDIAKGAYDVASSAVSYVARKLGSLVSRLYVSLNQLTERVFSRYATLVDKKASLFEMNRDNIDPVKFVSYKTYIVPQQALAARVKACLSVYVVLNDIERITSAPVKSGSEDWRTPEFVRAYNNMSVIGFDADRYDLINAPSAAYDKARVTNTLEALGYTVSNTADLIASVKQFAQYATKEYSDATMKKFVATADSLAQYEKMITMTDETLTSEQKDEMKHILQIRTARLWWMSHFIKAVFVCTNDVLVDMLKLCNIAEKCIVKQGAVQDASY